MDESQNKELSAIFHYCEFASWKKSLPFDLKISDNQLTYIIFDALLKSKTSKVSLFNALIDSIQFTDLADNFWYRNKRNSVLQWLMNGVMIFTHYVDIFIKEFSEISCVFTDTVREQHLIKVSICGRKRLSHVEKSIGRIPSTDGIPEATCRISASNQSTGR